MGDEMLLPTFFVIGAAKAGTTALDLYLSEHPEIEMTPKDPYVMIGPDFRERARWYAGMFPERRPVRGECTTGYSIAPRMSEVPGNIRELVPGARIVYMVRDPIDRAVAHYSEAFITHREQRPIEEAMRPEDPGATYIAGSCYATQLEAYLAHFEPGAILVVDSGDLRDRRRETLARIFVHVGAEPGFWSPSYEREHRVRAADNVRLGASAHRATRGRIGDAYRRIVPESARLRLRPGVRRLLGGRQVRPDPDPELRRRLAARFGPEADRLRELTGQPFASWSV